jgi:hypothetical protein
MPKKEWIKDLPDGLQLFVFQDSFFGIWYGFSVVLIYNNECVTRYDTAHKRAHRNVLGQRKGLIKKEWCENMSFKQAFEHALNDLSINYQAYLEFYLAN